MYLSKYWERGSRRQGCYERDKKIRQGRGKEPDEEGRDPEGQPENGEMVEAVSAERENQWITI